MSDVIAGWAQAQVAGWAARGVPRAAAERCYRQLSEVHEDVFVFAFEGGAVRVLDKPGAPASEIERGLDGHTRRAVWYLEFFRLVLSAHGMRPDGLIAMSMHDLTPQSVAFPMFAFQRRIGGGEILLPDVDALRTGFYRETVDRLGYGDKVDRAVFVGSTTGRLHTVASVAAGDDPRLRAGVAFRGVAEVDFRLPGITQCDTPAAAAAIRALGFGEGAADWDEQLKCKFLISMDGNGATCSRVALALKSNSVLVKYSSPYELYYFRGLRAGEHFVSVETDAEVPAVVRAEMAAPGRYRGVAEASARFFEAYLGMAPAVEYAGAVLAGYFGCFVEDTRGVAGGGDAAPLMTGPVVAPSLLVTGVVHVSNRGDIAFAGMGWIGDPDAGLAIEGFGIDGVKGVAREGLSYRALQYAGGAEEWCAAGAYAGSRGAGRALRGVAVRIDGARGLAVTGRFADGAVVGPVGNGEECQAPSGAALVGFRIDRPAETAEIGPAHLLRSGVLNRAPLVLRCEIDPHVELQPNIAEWVAARVAQPFGLVVHSSVPWASLSDGARASLAGWIGGFLREHARHAIWIACDTAAELGIVEAMGLAGRVLPRAAFVDETMFRPEPRGAKRYDAVYAGPMHDASRHELAALIDPVCLCFDTPDADGALYLSEVRRFMPQAALTSIGMHAEMARGRVGLVLGRGQELSPLPLLTMLCGVPVVNCVVDVGEMPWGMGCAASPMAVRDAVRQVISRELDPAALRQMAMTRMAEHRMAWRKGVMRLCTLLGGPGGNTFGGNFTALRAPAAGMPLRTVEALALALRE